VLRLWENCCTGGPTAPAEIADPSASSGIGLNLLPRSADPDDVSPAKIRSRCTTIVQESAYLETCNTIKTDATS